jgi:hypothetical protein
VGDWLHSTMAIEAAVEDNAADATVPKFRQ